MSFIGLTSRFECCLGFDSDGGEVLFHAAITPKSDIISGGVDDLNPIELSQNGPTTSTTTPTAVVTLSDVLKNPNILSLPLPPHIEDLDREAILTEGLFALIFLGLCWKISHLYSVSYTLFNHVYGGTWKGSNWVSSRLLSTCIFTVQMYFCNQYWWLITCSTSFRFLIGSLFNRFSSFLVLSPTENYNTLVLQSV